MAKRQYKKIPSDLAVYLHYLHQDGRVPGKELVRRYPQYLWTSIYRHMVKLIGVDAADKRHENKGRQ